MNRLLGIENDKDICRVHCATEDEIGDYEEGTTTGPELHPMRPFLDSCRNNSWNNDLCDMFIEYFEEHEGFDLTPANKEAIEKMFLDHLNRLGRTWRETHNFSSNELQERRLKSNQRARRNTRRVDVS
jgi:hypothetical protein